MEEESFTEANSNSPTQPNLGKKASGASADSVFVTDELEMESH